METTTTTMDKINLELIEAEEAQLMAKSLRDAATAVWELCKSELLEFSNVNGVLASNCAIHIVDIAIAKYTAEQNKLVILEFMEGDGLWPHGPIGRLEFFINKLTRDEKFELAEKLVLEFPDRFDPTLG